MKLQYSNIRWMIRGKTVVALTMEKGQRTKEKGHKIFQSIIKNKIGVTKYGIKILVWNLPCKVGLISPSDVIHLCVSSESMMK